MTFIFTNDGHVDSHGFELGQPTVSLSTAIIRVAVGESASCEVRVRNQGDLVDDFIFEIAGPAAAWTRLEPSSLPLFPKGEGTAHLCVNPPRSPHTPGGLWPFTLHVRSGSNPGNIASAQGRIEVRAPPGPDPVVTPPCDVV